MFNVLIVVLFIAMTFFITKSNSDRSVRTMMTNSAVTSCRSFETFISQLSISMQYFKQTPAAVGFFDGTGTTDALVEEMTHFTDTSDMIDNVWCFSSKGQCVDKNGEADPSELLNIRTDGTYSITYTDTTGMIMSSKYQNGDSSGVVFLKINTPSLGEKPQR